MTWNPLEAETFGCSRQGASHITGDTPCQDAFKIARHSATNVNALILTAADGHGASIHDLSETGSQLAVKAVTEELQAFADTFTSERSGQSEQDFFRADLPKAIVSNWQRKVEVDARNRFGDDYAEETDGLPIYIRYGSTLLAAMVTGKEVFLLAIGDGDIVKLDPLGEVKLHMEQDAPELKGAMTFSLASNDPELLFQTQIMDFELGGILTLSTDGLAKSFQNTSFFWEFVTATRERVLADGFEQTFKSLPDVLDYISLHGSGDDMTFVMVWLDGKETDIEDLTATHHSISLRDNEVIKIDGKSSSAEISPRQG